MSFVRKFFLSDTHFNHTNILRMQPRPFKSIEQHDEAMIERWNAVVSDDDVVYHLGDFALGLNNPERIRSIFSRLCGRKFLVYGTRYKTETGLRVRNLETGAERWLVLPVTRDDQESRASRDTLPGYAFLPDGKSLVVSGIKRKNRASATLDQKGLAEHMGRRAQRGRVCDAGFRPDKLGG